MDLSNFIIQFQDHLAPRLDTYEQAIYLYVFRHSRLLSVGEVTIGFKSARTRLATGVGEGGKPMSENTAYVKIASLQAKGCITRSGLANLNKFISGNSGPKAQPMMAGTGVFDGQEISAPYPAHPHRCI